MPNIPDQALEHALVFSGPVTYYAINDHLGTPQLFVDDAGAVVWQAEYEPFGKVSLTLSETENNIRFPGQYYDSETGLHYNWHRYYDPETGRYVSADPIGLDGGMNLYSYVEGNPVNAVDPMGLWVKLCGRKLGDRDQPQVRPRGNPLRHDYLLISGRVRSFQAGSNMIWSQGRVDRNEHVWNPKCEMICDDKKFDKYVLKAAQYAPKYSVIAYPGTTPFILGARNCQSWAREVLERAKTEYLKNENCPKCFRM